MFKRKLGRSGIEVSALGLGCMEMGGRMKDNESFPSLKENQPMFSLGDVNDEESIRTIHFALEAGVNFFDTAPAYGAGHSERVLGRALAGRHDQAVIATKFGKLIDEADHRFGRYESARAIINHIRQECEDSLRRLRTDTIDLYQFHQLDLKLDDFAEEVIPILEALVSAGKIRWYGWSTDDPVWARSERTIPIPGFRTFSQVEENIRAFDFGPLTISQMEEIEILLGRSKG